MARRQLQLRWPPFTTNLKVIMGVLAALWVVQIQITGPTGTFPKKYLALSAANIMEGRVWTLLSHAFFHADFMHLLFNGFALWLFGGEVDRRWSNLRFWRFCLLCALGGGLAVLATQFATWGIYAWLGYGSLTIARMLATPTIGFSGAIMGLVAAYCWHHWNRQLYFFFVRIPGKMLLPLFVVLDVLMVAAGQPISISGHLGGMLTGLLLVSGYWKPRKLKLAIRRWKRWGTGSSQSRSPDRRNDGRYFN